MFEAIRLSPQTSEAGAKEDPHNRFVKLPFDSDLKPVEQVSKEVLNWRKLSHYSDCWGDTRQAEIIGTLTALLYRYSSQSQISLDIFQCASASTERFPLDLTIDVTSNWQSILGNIRESLRKRNSLDRYATQKKKSNIAVAFLEKPCVREKFEPPPIGAEYFDLDHELSFLVTATEEGSFITIVYASQRLKKDTVVSLLDNLTVLQTALVSRQNIALDYLEILSPSEAEQLEAFSIGCKVNFGATDFLSAFSKHARSSPETVAVTYQSYSMSYGNLERERYRLAVYLQSRGVGPGHRVAVCLRPSPNILVGILAIWTLRAIYVPLDPSHSDVFIRRMLEDVSPRLVLTTTDLRDIVSDYPNIYFDDESWKTGDSSSQLSVHTCLLSDPAYIFYTSGTTGRAKGVVATHGNLIQYLHSAAQKYGFGAQDSFISLARYTFSISLWELLSPLLCGARVRILEREKVLSPSALCQELADITVLHAGPSLLGTMFRYLRAHAETPTQFIRMRHASSGGDMVSPTIMEEMKHFFPNAELFVIYGCTEVSCMGSSYEILREHKPATTFVGIPFPNVILRVLSSTGMQVPFGVVGEICFAGQGIVHGYLNLPELTAQKFLVDENGTRFYHTGDMGRVHSDGNLEILGRRDFQIQLHGMRIELAGIENTIQELGLSAQSAVVAKTLGPEDVRLIAFVVNPKDVSASTFRKRLSASLPDYMVPQQIVVLDAMPLTANGKLDRTELGRMPWNECVAKSLGENSACGTVANATEQVIADILARVLNRTKIDLERSFFDLGGHSLLGIVALQEIEKSLGIVIPPHVLFESTTVRDLVRRASLDTPQEVRPILLNRPGNTHLFMLSGVHIYRELAKRLDGHYSAYGVFDPTEVGSLEPEPGTHSVIDLAEIYLKTIRTIQPKGPYHLLGYSFAGLVAYEMAQQLMASGEEVPNLVLLDSHLPEWIFGFRYRVAQFRRVWKAPTRDVLAFVIRKTREAFGHNEQKTSQYQDIAQVAPLEAQRDITNRDAAATYLLELMSYAGEMTLIIAVDRLRNDPLKSPSCGWASYAPKLEVYNIDTDHYKLLTDDPYVSQVAQIVSKKRSSQNDKSS